MSSAENFFARLYKIEKPWTVTEVSLAGDDGGVTLHVEPSPA